MKDSCSFKLSPYKIAIKKTKGIIVHRAQADTTISDQYYVASVFSTH